MSLINTQVQAFKAQAFKNGKFIEVSDADLQGKWSVLIFMPAAFTFNCPTEIEDAADHYAEFEKAGAEVYIVTTDTHFSHKVWHETSAAVGKARFALVGDPTHKLTRAFDVHIDEEGLALRGMQRRCRIGAGIGAEGVVRCGHWLRASGISSGRISGLL